MLKIAATMAQTRSEGPGLRFAIWAQGCSIGCPACCNPEMLPACGGSDCPVPELLARILAAGVEGISLLGGEPFDQAAGFGLLAQRVREAGLGVMTFSGHTYAALRKEPRCRVLLANTDLLKAGPYVKARHSDRKRWMGSENQRLHFLTDRYRGHPDVREDHTQSITIDMSGEHAILSGWPPFLGRPNGVRRGDRERGA